MTSVSNPKSANPKSAKPKPTSGQVAAKRASDPEPRSAGPATRVDAKPDVTDGDASLNTGALDIALIHGRTPDGKGLQVIRRRDDTLEFGSVRPVEEGKPLSGDIVKLKPRANFPLLCDVETQFRLSSGATSSDAELEQGSGPKRKGPPRVTSDAYRKNWDAIYSRGRKSSMVN